MTSVSVRLRKRNARRLELRFVVEGVIDLAVERDDDGAVGIDHRLMAAIGQIENLEAMETNPGVGGLAGDFAATE